MNRFFRLTALLFLFIASRAAAQSTAVLRQKIQQLISTKDAVVGVAISSNNGKDTLYINGERHYPMQSVFKLHIALALLAQIDEGKFSFAQKIHITKAALLPNLYSPIREKYPEGATLSLAQILKYTVSESDNVGCEVLLRLIGGPQVIEQYFMKNNFNNVSIKINEEVQQDNWDRQFENWTTPRAANEVLKVFYYNSKKLLSKKSYAFIWKTLRETKTGEARLKGRLPKQAVVAHKTGSSGTNKAGITAAVNDIGVVFLPNGKYFFISVFVTASKEDAATNERIIADIAKAAWDYFNNK